jgi:hypothetical protein
VVSEPRRRLAALYPVPRRISLAFVLAIICTHADAGTFLIMTAIHGMEAEANPNVVNLAEEHGLLPVVALRLILVTVAAVALARTGVTHRTASRVLLLVIAGIGAFGAVSNVLSW